MQRSEQLISQENAAHECQRGEDKNTKSLARGTQKEHFHEEFNLRHRALPSIVVMLDWGDGLCKSCIVAKGEPASNAQDYVQVLL